MKIIAISDTHNHLIPINRLPDADVLVHAGDALIHGNDLEWESFCSWLKEAACKYECVIYVPGNHDRMFSGVRDLRYIEEARPANVLINRTLTYKGYTFLGSPIMRALDDTPRAYYWSDDLRRIFWENLWAINHQIVITHAPMYGTLDLARGENLGCEYLARHISRRQPLLHIHGHIHQAYGWEYSNKTYSINAALCNLETEPINPPWLINIENEEVTIEPCLAALAGLTPRFVPAPSSSLT